MAWSSYRDQITRIVIGEGITEIGDYVFESHSNVIELSLSNTVTRLGYDAFNYCTSLTTVVLPDSVTYLDNDVFEYCTSLTSVTMGSGVEWVDSWVFQGCDNLEWIEFTGSAPAFEYNAFAYITATVYYPGADSSWTADVRQDYDGSITWVPRYYEDPVSVTLASAPAKTIYCIGDTELDLTGLKLRATDAEGHTWNISDPDAVTVSGFQTSSKGRKTITLNYQGFTVRFDVYVHQSASLELQPSSGYPESGHDYSDNMDRSWEYTVPGATYLELTFSSSTETESGYDYIYLYDAAGNRIGEYDGTSLAGRTVTVSGDTVTVRLTTDGSSTYYGFSLDSIYAYTVSHEASGRPVYTAPTCYDDGYYTYTCGICGTTFRELDEGSAGHRYEKGFCTMCGLPENAMVQGTVGNITWVVSDTYQLFFLGSGELNRDYDVSWEEYRDQIVEVNVQKGITGIGYGTFEYYNALTRVTLGETVTSISGCAFRNCENLEQIIIPASVTYLESDAFPEGNDLTVTFGGTMAQWTQLYNGSRIPVICTDGNLFDYGTFGENGEYTWVLDAYGKLTISGQGYIEYLGFNAENARSRVTSVVVEEGITDLGSDIFSNMPNLKEVSLPKSLRSIDGSAFAYCVSLQRITIPDSVTEIGGWAFDHCESLTNVTIPASVTRLGDDIFEGCYSLDWVRLLGNKPEMETTFEGISSSFVVKYPADDSTWSGISTEDGAVYWMAVDAQGDPVKEVSLSGTCGVSVFWELDHRGELRIYGDGAMRDYSDTASPWYPYRALVRSVVVEEGVTTVGSNAFYGCASLKTAELADSVVSIGNSAFACCYGLRTVELADSVVSIGNSAFECCYGLRTVELPEQLQRIGSYVFSDCALTRVEIPEGITELRGTFLGCGDLTEVILPAGLSVIEEGTFAYCPSLKQITIPDSVIYLGNSVFENANGLEIRFLGDAPGFAYNTFYDCTVTVYCRSGNGTWNDVWQDFRGNVTWEEYGEVISDICGDELWWALDDMGTLYIDGSGEMYDYSLSNRAPWYIFREDIRQVYIYSDVKAIGNYAFYNCTNVERVEAWGSLDRIGNAAFGNCRLTVDLTGCYEMPTIASNAFSGATATVKHSGWAEGNRQYGGTLTWEYVYMAGSCGPNLTWTQDENGVLTITGTGPMTDSGWFHEGVTQVILPEGLTSIADSAFSACWELKEIRIPESVRSIGGGAFSGCGKLQRIEIPASVRIIGESAFENCDTLELRYSGTMEEWTWNFTEVRRPVTCRDGMLLSYGIWGENLRWLLGADGVLQVVGFGEMHDNYFTGDSSAFATATQLILPEELTGIYGDFSYLRNVDRITVPAGVKYINGGLHLRSDLWFQGNAPALDTELCNHKARGAILVYYPAGDPTRTDAAKAAFGSSVVFIPVEGDGQIRKVVIDSGSCGDRLTWTMWSDGTLSVEGTGAMWDYYDMDPPWYKYDEACLIRRIEIGQGVTAIGAWTFSSMFDMDSVSIADTVATIGESAFSWSGIRETVVIPASVTRIDEGAFGGLDGSVQFKGAPPAVQGQILYENWTVVFYPGNDPAWTEEVRNAMGDAYIHWIPMTGGTAETVSGEFGDGFTWTLEGTVLTISGTGDGWGDDSYENRKFWDYSYQVTEVILEEGITSVAESAFSGFYNLEEVTLPWTLETIGDNAFSGCYVLEEIRLPEGLETIGGYAFSECRVLDDILIPAGVTSIGNEAFSDSGIRVIRFAGDAPIYGKLVGDYEQPHVLCLYDRDNGTWDSFNTYENTLTWIGVPKVWEVNSVQAETEKMTSGEQIRLTANMSMGIYEDADVLWSVSQYGDAQVDLTANGLEATLTASTKGVAGSVLVSARTPGSAQSASRQIRILPAPTGVKILDEFGGEIANTVLFDTASTLSKTLNAQLLPAGAEAMPTWSWSDGAEACANFRVRGNSLEITARSGAAGEMTVTATVGKLSKSVTVKFVSLGIDREEIEGDDVPDMQLFAGKSKTLKIYDTNTGAALTKKQVTWSIPEAYQAYATVNASGKLTAKKVLKQVRIEVVATMVESPDVTVSYFVDIYPMTTRVDLLAYGEVVNGKTVFMDLAAGEELAVSAELYPADVLDAPVKWTVTDKQKVLKSYELEDSGNTVRIIANGAQSGTVTLKAEAQDGSKKSATLKVNVGELAENIQISAPAELVAGKKAALKATLYPENAANKKVTWSLVDPEDAAYVKLTEKGALTALNIYEEATVTVKAEAQDGSGTCGYATVRIVPKNPDALVLKYNGQVVNGGTILIDQNEWSLRLHAYCNGRDVSRNLSWTGVHGESISYPDGCVQILMNGNLKLTASYAGQKVKVTVKKTDMPESLTISLKSTKNVVTGEDGTIQIASGKNMTLQALVEYDSGKTGKKVDWSIVEGGEFAKITSGGKLTANKNLNEAKYVKVRAAAKEDSGIYEEIDVIIRPLAQGVELYGSAGGVMFSARSGFWFARSNLSTKWDISAAQEMDLRAEVYPFAGDDDETNAIQDVIWTVSNKNLADFVRNDDGSVAVDDAGCVTLVGYKAGSVTVTATAADGSGKKVTFKLKLVKTVGEIRWNDSYNGLGYVSVESGSKKVDLSKLVTVDPVDATDKKLHWRIKEGPDSHLATVTDKGVLSAKNVDAPAKITLEVISQDGGMYSDWAYPAELVVLITPKN